MGSWSFWSANSGSSNTRMASVLSARTPLRHDSHQTDEGSRRPTLSLVAAVALGFGRGSEPEEMRNEAFRAASVWPASSWPEA